uniref:CACN subunit beta associated regulatory protein n=1 Tax=Varanus komodoensis TaxID=61221 RepID=A0A8D2Q4T9_VARKO
GARSPGNVLHFFTRLRRHTSLEGASPYFKIKKWKLEMSQRASSLDTRGSPKRHQFQRQRAASESMDQEDRDAHQTDIIQYIARTDNVASPPRLPFALCARPCKRSVSPACRLDRSEPSAPAPAEPPPPDQQPTPVCHDIWSLRASLEMCASAEQGNDRDSIRSEGGDSASSSGGPPSPKPEGAEADAGPRKLLQMDSGYASIEGPGGREAEAEAQAGGAAGGALPHSPLAWAPHGQLFPAREGLPRRDYSIDEKTDALFHAFVRHDPQFDESPLRAKLRSRAHLRKQWQRARQHSDPGARYPAALERHRTPLRRGDSVDGPPEGRGAGALPPLGLHPFSTGASKMEASGRERTPANSQSILRCNPSGPGTFVMSSALRSPLTSGVGGLLICAPKSPASSDLLCGSPPSCFGENTEAKQSFSICACSLISVTGSPSSLFSGPTTCLPFLFLFTC